MVRGSASYDKHLGDDRFDGSSADGFIRSGLVDGIVVIGSEWLQGEDVSMV